MERKEIKTIKEDTGEVSLDSPKEDLLEILKRKILRSYLNLI